MQDHEQSEYKAEQMRIDKLGPYAPVNVTDSEDLLRNMVRLEEKPSLANNGQLSLESRTA